MPLEEFEDDRSNATLYLAMDEVTTLEIEKGKTFTISCGGVPVKPPHLMLEGFIELPDFLELIQDEILESEGTYEDRYTLKAIETGSALVPIGYRHLQDGRPTHVKCAFVTVR